jgi:hypothetical protein
MPSLRSATGTNTSVNEAKHAVILPSVLAIGFTGHRHLPDEAKSGAQILNFLKEKKEKTPGVVYGISSVAVGGDLLFAEACIQLGLPVRVLLPMPKEQFREDFDEATWRRAEQVLRKSMYVEVTGEDQARDARYYECGIEMVLQCSVLLTVWDGEPSHGLGGTEQIVSFAKAEGRPITWIHSNSGAIQHFNEKVELLNDPELDFLNALPETGPKPDSNSPGDLARAWFQKIDTNATHASPTVRRLAAIPILCTAAASVLSTVGTLAGGSAVWIGIGAGLGFTVGALPAVLKLHQRAILWARIRTATEICRSNLAFWKTPAPYNAIGPEVIPELSGMLMSLSFLKMSDSSEGKEDLKEFKRDYREGRLQGQLDFFLKSANRSEKKAKQYQFAITGSIAIALVANIWMLVSVLGVKGISPVPWNQILPLSGSVFFQVATIAGAMLVVNDYERRRIRYRELHQLLIEWDKQLEFARTWPVVIRIAEMVEKALLAEVIEWRSLLMHHKLPRR